MRTSTGGVGATNVTVIASSTDSATAESIATTGGIVFAVGINRASSTRYADVKAYIGGGTINVTEDVRVEANEFPESDSRTKGVAVAGRREHRELGNGGDDQPERRELHRGALANEHDERGRHDRREDRSLRAAVGPTYNDRERRLDRTTALHVQNHNLATGDQVEYDPLGNTVINGLQVSYVDPDDINGTQLRRIYNVIVVGDDDLLARLDLQGLEHRREPGHDHVQRRRAQLRDR